MPQNGQVLQIDLIRFVIIPPPGGPEELVQVEEVTTRRLVLQQPDVTPQW